MEIAINENHIIRKDYKKKSLINIDIYPAFRNDAKGKAVDADIRKGIRRLKKTGVLSEKFTRNTELAIQLKNSLKK